MRSVIIYIMVILLIIGVCNAQWSFKLDIDWGTAGGVPERSCRFGTHIDATDGFDEGIDLPAPPPPDFHRVYFPCEDTLYRWLLEDYRAVSDSVFWVLIINCMGYVDYCSSIVSWCSDSVPFSYGRTYFDTLVDMTTATDMGDSDTLYLYNLPDTAYLMFVSYDLVPEQKPQIPHDFALSAHPNPFNSAVTISLAYGSESAKPLSTSPPGAYRVEIFDIAGRRVAQLPDGGSVGAGFTPARDDGAGNNDRDGARPSPTEVVWQPDASLTSGVYLVRAKIGGESVTKRIVYLK